MTPTGLARLANDEGETFSPVRDTRGFLTIGRGHNLDKKPISQMAVDQIFRDDVSDATDAALKYAWYLVLSPVRQDVVVNMIFNLGPDGFSQFKNTHSFLAASEFGSAASQIWTSKAAWELPNRYRRLYWAMKTDTWDTTKWQYTDGANIVWSWPGDIGTGTLAVKQDE